MYLPLLNNPNHFHPFLLKLPHFSSLQVIIIKCLLLRNIGYHRFFIPAYFSIQLLVIINNLYIEDYSFFIRIIYKKSCKFARRRAVILLAVIILSTV